MCVRVLLRHSESLFKIFGRIVCSYVIPESAETRVVIPSAGNVREVWYCILAVDAVPFLFHVFENIGMTLGLLPITGIPLPFLSYGGSNMTTNMGGLGLVLNVTRNRSLATGYSTPQTEPMNKLRYLTRR